MNRERQEEASNCTNGQLRHSNLVILVALRKENYSGEASVRNGGKKLCTNERGDSFEGLYEKPEIQRQALR